MQTIGERLLEARQRRGVSIREAAESTKVRGDYLAAMEANQFDSIPLADVYRRGFLKIYARFLRLDSERVVNDFNAILAARNPGPVKASRRATDFVEPPARSIEPREPEGMDEFSSGAIEVAARPENRRKTILIAGGASLAVIVLILLIRGLSSSPTPEPASGREGASTAQAATSSEGEITFTSKHTKPLQVRITRSADGYELASRNLTAGASFTLRTTGEINIYATPLENLQYRVNGGQDFAFPRGSVYGKATVPAKGR